MSTISFASGADLSCSQYGSGYPGITGRGTAGRGFPFYFWPVVWAGEGTDYLYPTEVSVPFTHKNQADQHKNPSMAHQVIQVDQEGH